MAHECRQTAGRRQLIQCAPLQRHEVGMVLLAQFHRIKVAKENGRLAVGCSRNIDEGSASEGGCSDDDSLESSTLPKITDKCPGVLR